MIIWFWFGRMDWTVQAAGEAIGKSSVSRPHIGGLFPNTDAESLWSVEWKKEFEVLLKYTFCSLEANNLFWWEFRKNTEQIVSSLFYFMREIDIYLH